MLRLRDFYKGIRLLGEASDISDNVEGGIWHNSTTNRIKAYLNAAVREVTTNDQVQTLSNKNLVDNSTAIVDNTDPTIQVAFNAAGATGTKTTILSSQTADRVITLPDATDTLVGKATTDVLTNKSIDGDTNTISDVALASLKTEAGDANKFVSRDGTGAVVSTVAVPTGGVVGTDDAQTLTNKSIDGDNNTLTDISISSLKTDLASASTFISRDASGVVISTKAVPVGAVVGTTDSQTLSSKNLVDNSTAIVDSVDATKQITFDAGGTTGTKTIIQAAQTANRTIALPDASTTVVGTDTSQVLTNKDIDGGVASNTRRITLPKDTLANLSALTRKEATLVYATDGSNKGPYYDDGTTLTQIGSGGGGDTSIPFTFVNNQASPADVTGFLVSSGTSNGFAADMNILRRVTDPSPDANAPDAGFNTAMLTGFASTVSTITSALDGSIYAGGAFTDFDNNNVAKIAKLNSDGSENTTFSTNVGTGFDDNVRAIKMNSLGQVAIGGGFSALNGNTRRKLILLNADGTEDSTFVTNLGTKFPSGAVQGVYGIGMQSDDAMVVVGNFNTFNGGNPAHVVRINADGTEDATFSANVGSGLNVNTLCAIIQADGKSVLGGAATTLNGVSIASGLVRLNTNGTLDTTFDTNLGTGFNNSVMCVIEQPDNKLLVSGDFTIFNGNSRSGLVRLNSDGTEDTTFYTNLGTAFGGGPVMTVVLQNDNKIIAGGAFTDFNGNGLNYITRLNSDGTEDAVFTNAAGAGPDSIIVCSNKKSTGELLFGGSFSQYDGQATTFLFQFAVISELNQTITFYGTYNNKLSSWKISDPIGAFDDALGEGYGFSITAGGQLQYTSSNLAGTPSTHEMRFRIRSL